VIIEDDFTNFYSKIH